jgi:hypothetical protein
MTFPSPWIDALFAKLSIRYGSAFLAQWPDADPALLKADWAEVLAGFANHPASIRYAIENLPERPVNAIQFRNLARLAPLPQVKALAAPVVDQAKRRAAIELAIQSAKKVA